MKKVEQRQFKIFVVLEIKSYWGKILILAKKNYKLVIQRFWYSAKYAENLFSTTNLGYVKTMFKHVLAYAMRLNKAFAFFKGPKSHNMFT